MYRRRRIHRLWQRVVARSTLVTAMVVVIGLSRIIPGVAEPSRHLDIGLGATVTSLDPHYHRYTPNQTVAFHIFDPLIRLDDHLTLTPALALSWTAIEPTVWRFHLRPHVRFHDGQPLTSRDVAASLRRPGQTSGSPFSNATSLAVIADIEVIDDLTLDIHTVRPASDLPNSLANLAILPAAMETLGSDAFRDLRNVVGTGPFRLLGGDPKTRLFLAANPSYWGDPPPWNRVTLHIIPNDARRVTALVDGTVDLIENVPPADAARLMTNSAVRVVGRASTRVIYLGLDVGRTRSPFITGSDGQPIDNPLRNPDVRRAMSLAFDREAIVRDVLQGHGTVANQILAPEVIGHAPDLPPLAYDLAGGRRLMAQAGYENGFALTLHCPNDRYVADNQIADTLGWMLDRLGIRTTVDCMPARTFFERASAGAFSMYLAGLSVAEGDGGHALTALLARPEPARGDGALNRGGWGDQRTDDLLEQATVAADPRHREALLQKASHRAAEEHAIIPLHIQQSIWAMHRRLEYTARVDELTLAQCVRRAPH